MRSSTFKINRLEKDCVARYPDEVCFCFSPNFLEIETDWPSCVFTISVSAYHGNAIGSTYEIKASCINHSCKVYLSRLFELLFLNPRSSRCINAKVNVRIGNTTALCNFEFETLVVWGGLALGERFGALGVFDREGGSAAYNRNLVWFKNFPFKVSLFRYSDNMNFYGRFDNSPYSDTPIYNDTIVWFFDEIENCAPLPVIEDGTASAPYRIVYFATASRFLVRKDGKYYATWSGEGNVPSANNGIDRGASSYYVASSKDPRPRTDVTYLRNNEDTVGIERHQFINGALEFLGYFTDLGFEDIDAQRLFPTATRNATIQYKIGSENVARSVFDHSFDYTFFQTGENVALINLIVNHDTDGHYLRWIDRQGNLQYYLFTQGQITLKNKLGSDKVSTDTPVGGMYFANHVRLRTMETTSTYKCCAVHLPADIYEYVSSIISAPIVDRYMGKNENGDELWCPVVVQSTTANYDPHKPLNDLEFSFNIPDLNIQTL